jgi:phospholipase D1/2
MLGAQYIGEVMIATEEVLEKQVVEGWYDVLNTSGKVCHAGASLHLKIIYHPIDTNPLFKHGAAEGEHFYGVPCTYFPCRTGCRLTLYQDAHAFDGELPDVILENGEKFEHRCCWEEMCTAILKARHMVYIAGWSVYVKVRLIRDVSHPIPDGGDLTLGDLLRRKAAEGVRVLVLAWDDKTSHSNPFFKTVCYKSLKYLWWTQ